MKRSLLSALLIITLASAAVAPSADAQTGYPMLMSIKPVAAAVGETSEHVISSRYNMFGTYRVLVSGSGVTGQAVLPEVKDGKAPDNLTTLTVKFAVDSDAQPGVRDIRLATPQGISTVGQLVIVRDRVIQESGKNNTDAEAMPVNLPATICGCIESNEDVDVFRFDARAGQKLTFHTRCMRLQDRIHDLQQHADPIIAIRNAAGSTLATADNDFFGDPMLAFQVPADGTYFLEVRDVRYQGNRYWEYSIEVSEQPFAATAFPLAVTSDGSEPIELIGTHFPDAVDQRQAELSKAAREQAGALERVLSYEGQPTNPVPVFVTDSPTVLEQQPPSAEFTDAQTIPLPCVVNGRIESTGDVDLYRFTASKGERYTFEVLARRLQSELDSIIRIIDSNGRSRGENDDLQQYKHTYADSRIENWTAPEDGEYALEIRDLHLRGGSAFVYAISMTRADPTFDLYLDTDKTQLTPGISSVIFVNAVRKNGFDGEIELAIEGLPAGVTAVCGRILKGRRDGAIVLTAAGDATLDVAEVRVRGRARAADEPDSPELNVAAIPYQETYQPGGGRGHWPVDSHVVAVAAPADIRAVRLSTYQVTLQPGASVRIDVEIERAEGFTANVQLDLLYRHLNSIYADPLPPGITIDARNSRTLLTASDTKGHITLTAAKDAAAVENMPFSVMANVSLNFVMKASYCSDPVRISVVP